MLKWNYKTLEYEEYTVPADWKVKTISTDMFEKVNCAACGTLVEYGAGYSSIKIKTIYGFGYTVCYECFKKEIEEEKDYLKDSLTDKQRNFIVVMNKYCEEKFDLSYPRTQKEASYYVKEHIDEFLNKTLYSKQRGKENL